jgi:hypothetical protein
MECYPVHAVIGGCTAHGMDKDCLVALLDKAYTVVARY